jgi:hypothetical protein
LGKDGIVALAERGKKLGMRDEHAFVGERVPPGNPVEVL